MTKSNAIIIAAARAALAAALTFAASAAAPSAAFAQAKSGAASKKLAPGDYYTCVMHPEIKSKKPGHCPKCFMDLRLKHAEPGGQGATPDAAPAAAATGATAPAAIKGDYGAPVKMSIPDVEVLDQDGHALHFYTDLVKGKTVAINFIFTTCTTICPPLGATFARVQKELGERAGRDVQIISISVDPATDTPERMKAWGAKFKAGAGWTFVTGRKPQVDELLRALGAQTSRPEDHSPAVLIGNDARGQWMRAYGLARPTQLVQMINDALAGQLNPTTKEPAQ
ncbi:MAG TPA: SCO family protein [Pyrinomonadaceae bacterium]|jgi:cytochrome oxidase Cu insertion factor (SCO1/SenC/PrrC family)